MFGKSSMLENHHQSLQQLKVRSSLNNTKT